MASAKTRYVRRFRRGLVVKGLSRLPVTEEIAGSNPVEPAIKTESHLWFFFYAWTPTGYEPQTCGSANEERRPRRSLLVLVEYRRKEYELFHSECAIRSSILQQSDNLLSTRLTHDLNRRLPEGRRVVKRVRAQEFIPSTPERKSVPTCRDVR